MYIPAPFEERDVAAVHGRIRAHPLGALVTLTPNGPDANHIPFLVHADPLPFGTLHGHLARANPAWRDFAADMPALVIFQGPDRFISPSWYPSKRETAKAVPTWNYVVVHAHGPLRVVDDRAWVRAHLEQLTNEHEASRPEPWKVTDAPAEFIDRMAGAVVGIEIPIVRLLGKWKLSQNRSAADRHGVIDALTREGTESALTMADLVREADRNMS